MKEVQYTMEGILEQEKSAELASFSAEDAWKLGCLMHDLCAERALPVAVSIELAGQVVFQLGMSGSSPDNDRWIAGKRAITALTHHSSLFSRLKAESKGGTNASVFGLDPTKYLCAGGCVPIFVKGTGYVGSVTVSGLADTEDHALSLEALARFAEESKVKC